MVCVLLTLFLSASCEAFVNKCLLKSIPAPIHDAPSLKQAIRSQSFESQPMQNSVSVSSDTIIKKRTVTDITSHKNQAETMTIQKFAMKLWILPFLSILSGLSPAVSIIAQSHLSQLPDCPIAHEDMYTYLLWPAMATRPISTIFQTPAAAITDEQNYSTDWNLVWSTYFSYTGLSLVISFLLGAFMYQLLYEIEDDLR